jgi:ribosome-associated protein
MDIRKLQRAIVDGLEDVKAQNIVVFNTEAMSPLFERVIIASGNSNRQTKALASSVRETVKKRGLQVLRTEGEENGEWIIVDCGAAVAHIMQPAIRDYYHLEEIWGTKPVRLKGPVKSEARGAMKSAAARPTLGSTSKVAAKKAAAKPPAARKSTPAKAINAVKAAVKAKPAAKKASKTSHAPKAMSKAPAKTAAKKATRPANPKPRRAAKPAPRRS